MEPLYLYGCRHDILGHYLKGIGLLRTLSQCADENRRDPKAEGWWDMERGCFCLCSEKYSTEKKLTEFFAKHYQPTPFFSPWNRGGGLEEKKEVVFSIDQSSWREFWTKNRDKIVRLTLNQRDRKKAEACSELYDKPIRFMLSGEATDLVEHSDITIEKSQSKHKRPKPIVQFSWSDVAKGRFFNALETERENLEMLIRFTVPVKRKFVKGKTKYCLNVQDEKAFESLSNLPGVKKEIRIKESGKKAVIANLEKNPKNPHELIEALETGRSFFPRLQDFKKKGANVRTLLEEFRESMPSLVVEGMDSVFTTRVADRTHNNPLFLNRGNAGNAEIFLTFWDYFLKTKNRIAEMVEHALIGDVSAHVPPKDGKGMPFFPDAIKTYNIGLGWVTEKYPFNGLDYILAVEGAFAMRGSVARTLAANSKRFAAFPFVFDSCEDMVDDANEVKGTANALWFPLWNRPATFVELSSFISDAQTRLPGKEARFNGEFVRALNAQGVDAGFVGWQEFRFKMKASRVPWITTGRYVKAAFRTDATSLNRALYPLDESRFLDQFEISWKGKKASSRSPHKCRRNINEAMETAAHEPTAPHCLNLLVTIFRACRQIAVSKSFREDLSNKRGIFFRPLPAEDWHELFGDFDVPEFRIARALASISGLQKQRDGTYSKTLPMLGSILPLKLGARGWKLPNKEDRSNQAVWSGSNLCHDLAAVLARRYMDSLGDDRPALLSKYGAPLDDVLTFLRGELDDQLIAQWTESLSLIGWQFSVQEEPMREEEEELPAIPPEYAALRTLVELECELQKEEEIKKRRSQKPISLLCTRSPSALPLAVSEALRWIAIWGVPNPYRGKSAPEKNHLAGRDIIHLETASLSFSTNAARLAAAVCIPLHWRDRYKLFKAVSIPQTD